MTFFAHAIVKKPGHSIKKGISSTHLCLPLYEKALQQHHAYLQALKKCGLEVEILNEDEGYPDSTFVEDTAVVTERVAIITRLGVPSRQGEEKEIKGCLQKFFAQIEQIKPPGTLEGGDVLRIEDLFFIGLSSRTNLEGALQLQTILWKYDYKACIIHDLPQGLLHLKSGITYLGDNQLLMTKDFCGQDFVGNFEPIIVPDGEEYAANSLRLNQYVLVPKGYKGTEKIIQSLYPIILVETSEFQKIDGGLSCLSLRF